nr:UDP-2,3-diacylglucosamine diphosphatase LpxI [Frigidibacter sp. ROC022]
MIAGQGRLPALLTAHLQAEGRAVTVFAPQGFTPEGVAAELFRFEHLGSLIAGLAAEGYDSVCLAGAARRPRFDPAALDAATAPLVPRIMAAMAQGDDGLLRFVIGLFEEAGLQVVGAHELMPSLVALPPGPAPDAGMQSDAGRGAAILAALGPLDVGQACVVAGGHCLGIETLQGTAALLDFVARSRGLLDLPPGGVLVKRSKPGQDLRIDLPAIGPDTLDQATAAGLGGICAEAGRVMFLDRDRLFAEAEQRGLRIWASP